MVDTYYQDTADSRRIRRLKIGIVSFAVIVFVLLVAIPLIQFLQSGEIVVSTNSSANLVTLTRDISGSGEKGSNAFSEQKTGALSARVKSGQYTVTVKNKFTSAQQVVIVKARHTVHVTINLAQTSQSQTPLQFEPVASFATHDVKASPAALYYINQGNNELYEIGTNNQAQAIDSQQAFQSVQWINASLGVAQAENGQYYAIQNGNVTLLSTPFVSGGLAIYAVTPNGTVYISSNYGLYRGTVSGGFTKIYSLADQDPLIVAGNNAVAVFEGGPDGISKATGQATSTAILSVSPNGALIQKLDADAYEAAWSPNGKYLVATDDGSTTIFNTALQQVASVPNNNVNAPVWLNNQVLLYGVSTGLWEYNIKTNQSQLLANTALNGSISEISPSTDGSYAYVSTINQQGSSPTYQLSRLGFKGQAVSSTLSELQVFLPNSVNGCGFDYINFSGINIAVSGPPSQQQSCLQQAQSYLTEYAVNTSSFTFSFTPITSSD